jgi:Family of unknown function (DUF5995)
MSQTPITSIVGLADRLTAVTDLFGREPSRFGYFAALYQVMTRRVQAGIASGRFSDGSLMERLACHFASRYFAALDAHGPGGVPPRCWAVSFDAASRWRPVILQHLLLGMNAHINFDLGIAVAEVSDATPGGLGAVRADFLEINAVLAELLTVVQERIASVSPWMGLLDRVGGRTEQAVVNFSMDRARDAAWRVAERVAPLNAAERASAVAALDREIAEFAKVVEHPGALISLALLPARVREVRDVTRVIAALQAV